MTPNLPWRSTRSGVITSAGLPGGRRYTIYRRDASTYVVGYIADPIDVTLKLVATTTTRADAMRAAVEYESALRRAARESRRKEHTTA